MCVRACVRGLPRDQSGRRCGRFPCLSVPIRRKVTFNFFLKQPVRGVTSLTAGSIKSQKRKLKLKTRHVCPPPVCCAYLATLPTPADKRRSHGDVRGRRGRAPRQVQKGGISGTPSPQVRRRCPGGSSEAYMLHFSSRSRCILAGSCQGCTGIHTCVQFVGDHNDDDDK